MAHLPPSGPGSATSAAFTWDAGQYRRFSTERDRPYFDLTGRVHAESPAQVIDLGCGDARLTATLAHRWPSAHISGVDSSEQMLADARMHGRDATVTLHPGDLADWAPNRRFDVILSNAAFQWVAAHERLLRGFVDALAPGGWLAFQVPGNRDAPSHTLLREVAARPAYRDHTAGAARRNFALDPAEYTHALLGLGCVVDAWETTYQHVLTGPDPVLEWVRGTGLRPFLQALPAQLRDGFQAEYGAELARAYPSRDGITLLAFRRVFVVAHKPA